jgi:hypothetical protein
MRDSQDLARDSQDLMSDSRDLAGGSENCMSGLFDAAFLLKKILTRCGACCILLCILNALAEENMNKKTITALSIGAVAIIGASILGCDGFANEPKENSAGTAAGDRKAGDAHYDDGDYTFYFKNGSRVHGDCDGYNSDPDGKTTIYEYGTKAIDQWEKRLINVGIRPEKYRTHKAKYCWVRFDTNKLIGVSFEGYGSLNFFGTPNADFRTISGKKINIKPMKLLHYAGAGQNFITGEDHWDAPAIIQKLSNIKNELMEGQSRATMILVFEEEKERSNAIKAFENAGIPSSFVIEKNDDNPFMHSVLIYAEYFDWFAFDL